MNSKSLILISALAIAPMVNADPSFSHRIVVEEATGTWCGFCIRGIVAIDELAEQYPEDFIPICIHSGDDPMELASYPTPMSTENLPRMCVNRDAGTVNDPSVMATYYNIMAQMDPEGEIVITDCELSADHSEMNVKVAARFDHDADGSAYGIGFVLIENDVYHPDNRNYRQTNAYAGGELGEMGGYELLPNYIEAEDIKYQYVARAAYGEALGFEGSVPLDFVAFEPFEYSQTLAVPAYVDNVNNLQLIALLLDADGKVINADRYSLSGYEIQEKEWVAPTLSQPDSESVWLSWPDGYVVSVASDATATLIVDGEEYVLEYANWEIASYLNDLFFFYPYDVLPLADGTECRLMMSKDAYTLQLDGVEMDTQDLDYEWQYGSSAPTPETFAYTPAYADGVVTYSCEAGYFCDLQYQCQAILERDGAVVATYGEGNMRIDIDWNTYVNTIVVTLDPADMADPGSYTLTIPSSSYWVMDLYGSLLDPIDLVCNFEIASSSISTVGTDSRLVDVYNVHGMLVQRQATAQQIKGLPHGIYIVNGKKMIK